MSAEWNFMDPASRGNLLRTVKNEAAQFFDLAERLDWQAPTACAEWQVRDQVGHLVDVTEGYFAAFDHTRQGTDPAPPLGVRVLSERANEKAQAFRGQSQEDMLKRVRADFDQMIEISEGLTDEEWAGLLVTHPYMGPLPAGFYSEFQLIDYTLHSWDMREKTQTEQRALSGDAADLLLPVMLIVWSATADTSGVKQPFSVGVTVTSGNNAGSWRFDATPDGLSYEPADVSDMPTVLEYDPASLALDVYGRARCGTIRGDTALADKFHKLFFSI
jgi:uncharacterized protein (TIGR03083 family)